MGSKASILEEDKVEAALREASKKGVFDKAKKPEAKKLSGPIFEVRDGASKAKEKILQAAKPILENETVQSILDGVGEIADKVDAYNPVGAPLRAATKKGAKGYFDQISHGKVLEDTPEWSDLVTEHKVKRGVPKELAEVGSGTIGLGLDFAAGAPLEAAAASKTAAKAAKAVGSAAKEGASDLVKSQAALLSAMMKEPELGALKIPQETIEAWLKKYGFDGAKERILQATSGSEVSSSAKASRIEETLDAADIARSGSESSSASKASKGGTKIAAPDAIVEDGAGFNLADEMAPSEGDATEFKKFLERSGKEPREALKEWDQILREEAEAEGRVGVRMPGQKAESLLEGGKLTEAGKELARIPQRELRGRPANGKDIFEPSGQFKEIEGKKLLKRTGPERGQGLDILDRGEGEEGAQTILENIPFRHNDAEGKQFFWKQGGKNKRGVKRMTTPILEDQLDHALKLGDEAGAYSLNLDLQKLPENRPWKEKDVAGGRKKVLESDELLDSDDSPFVIRKDVELDGDEKAAQDFVHKQSGNGEEGVDLNSKSGRLAAEMTGKELPDQAAERMVEAVGIKDDTYKALLSHGVKEDKIRTMTEKGGQKYLEKVRENAKKPSPPTEPQAKWLNKIGVPQDHLLWNDGAARHDFLGFVSKIYDEKKAGNIDGLRRKLAEMEEMAEKETSERAKTLYKAKRNVLQDNIGGSTDKIKADLKKAEAPKESPSHRSDADLDGDELMREYDTLINRAEADWFPGGQEELDAAIKEVYEKLEKRGLAGQADSFRRDMEGRAETVRAELNPESVIDVEFRDKTKDKAIVAAKPKSLVQEEAKKSGVPEGFSPEELATLSEDELEELFERHLDDAVEADRDDMIGGPGASEESEAGLSKFFLVQDELKRRGLRGGDAKDKAVEATKPKPNLKEAAGAESPKKSRSALPASVEEIDKELDSIGSAYKDPTTFERVKKLMAKKAKLLKK